MHESIGVCLIFFCSFSVTASSRAAAASRLLSVWTGCLIRTKLCWHLIFFFPQTYIPVPLLVVRSKPEHLIMSAWGVKQTQCQENCATHVHNRALEGCFFISQIVVCTWNLPSGRSGEFPEIYLPDANEQKKKKEKETTKTNVAVHHFPSGCRIQPDQTWHNKHLYLQELYSSFLHLSVQISLSICLKTPVTTGTNMKICSLSLNLFFLSQ